MAATRAWRSANGRIRLGFRLLLFLTLGSVVATCAGLFSPRVLPWSAAPTLLGALLAGWGLLALEGRPHAALGFRLDRGAVHGLVVGLVLGVVLGLLWIVEFRGFAAAGNQASVSGDWGVGCT